MVIFDRYFLDLLIDPKRARIKGFENLLKFFYRLIPQPDISIFLVGDGDEVNARKPELGVQEINELCELYSFYSVTFGDLIDTTQKNEEAVLKEFEQKIRN